MGCVALVNRDDPAGDVDTRRARFPWQNLDPGQLPSSNADALAIAFKKKNLAISRPDCALLGRSSIALSSSSILFHMKDRGVPSMANPFSGIIIHWIIISSASPSTRAASPAVLLNQIDPISHNLNMISSNFFFSKAIILRPTSRSRGIHSSFHSDQIPWRISKLCNNPILY